MNYSRAVVILAVAAPVYAQYGGPAVLTRGQAPAAMSSSQIDFRPFLSLTGGYDYGLNGVGVDPNGKAFNESSYSVEATGGISGLHSWKHTQVGLNYSASVRHFPGRSFYDGFDQTLMLSITHQMTRHIMFTLSTNAGFYTQNFNQQTLPQTIAFDPATTFVPTNDFFDNRTMYFSTQAAVQIQKTNRLSFSFGLDGFATRRRSTALYGVIGEGVRGDVQYRITRRSTIGAGYNFLHYSYSHILSSADLHSFLGSYAIRLTRSVEFAATGGAIRYETKFIQSVPVDPAIAILIGINSTNQLAYTRAWSTSGQLRLSYAMRRGVVYVSGGRSVTPGNGLFLTSVSNSVAGGYTYTALRKWSASASASYNRSDSLANLIGAYGNYAVSLSLSRQIAPATHGVLSFNARKYESPDFNNYNKWSYSLRLGLAFAPGDIPLRLW
ncbi:MAG TPA: hypothetical protein VNV86_15270 [Candidatus Acidoferrum sp.]|nr:hypothetical protein [Candidatus Acidoferrum sp.]